MAATSATIGKGTTLGYATTQNGSYTTIGEVFEVGQPEATVGNVDATHYTSDNSFIEKLSVQWQDVSDVPFALNYVKAQETTLRSLVGTARWFKITLGQDSSTYVFPGFISRLGGEAIPNRDKIMTRGSITVTGPVTFTAGS